jgi:predicted transcriptional regulator
MTRVSKGKAKELPLMSAGEYRLMDVLWKLGSATVGSVTTALKRKYAYTTVLSTLRTLERKGYVRHTTDGRTFIYSAVVPREDARRHILKHVTAAFFGGSPRALMLQLADAGDWDEDIGARLRDLLGED